MRELVLGAEYLIIVALRVTLIFFVYIHRWELVLGAEELSVMDITWLRLPVPDYSAPSLSTIIMGVRFIAAQVCLYYHHGVSVYN